MLRKIENAVAQHTHGKRTDYDMVTREGLKTAPKCMEDVPMMIHWFKKFGGGTAPGCPIKHKPVLACGQACGTCGQACLGAFLASRRGRQT